MGRTKNELVQVEQPETLPADPNSAAFQQFDAEDDQQILAEIQGRNLDILDRLVYSYSDRRGHTVTGLSLTGVRETVREMNRRGLARIKITAAPPIIHETDDYIDAIVYAEDGLNGGGSWGTKRQAKQVGSYANPFALEQALSKAQRNAMFALIPAAYVVEMIRDYTDDGRAHTLAGGVSRAAEAPARNGRYGAAAAPAAERPEPKDRGNAPVANAAPAVPALTALKGDPITEPQLTRIRNLLQRNDLDEAELIQKLGVETLADLTKQRASQIIDRLLQRAEQSKASA